MELQNWLSKNIDEEINEETFQRLIRHYEFQLKDYSFQDPTTRNYTKNLLVPQYQDLLKEQSHSPVSQKSLIQNAKIRLMIFTEQWKSARKTIEKLSNRQDRLSAFIRTS